jgi:hypothetical protein
MFNRPEYLGLVCDVSGESNVIQAIRIVA